MARLKMETMIANLNTLTEKPVKYLTVQNDIQQDIKNLVKSLYDYTKSQESKLETDQALQKIIVNDFDDEQIWQQIDIQNSQRLDQLVWDVANCLSNKSELSFPIKFPEENNDIETGTNEDLEPDDASDMNSNSSANQITLKDPITINTRKDHNKSHISKQKGKASIVDDQFFKLQDMESFLLSEEKKEVKNRKDDDDDDDEGSINMFDDIDSEGSEDAGGKEMMYTDFFNESGGDGEDFDYEGEISYDDDDEDVAMAEVNEKSKKKVRFVEPDNEESDLEINSQVNNKQVSVSQVNEESKSEFELRQQRLKQQISKLEEKTLTEAPWQLKGEIVASKRPQNSLLEEVLDFDLTTRPPPIITEQTTVTLEGLIKQRVKDKAWDDVVKKEKPVDDQLLFKKPEVLDQSKSKQSLAQVYEAEYLKQKQALSGDVQEDKEPEAHTEIRDTMTKLFAKLDALCHYHYTPKPPQAEIKIVSNVPAISMEEVAPVATSDATLLAPEEVKRKRKGDLMSKDERTKTDKNRARRKMKRLQRKKGQVEKVTEHRNTTKAVEARDKSLKTSKSFFQQLNDNTTSLIKLNAKKSLKNKG